MGTERFINELQMEYGPVDLIHRLRIAGEVQRGRHLFSDRFRHVDLGWRRRHEGVLLLAARDQQNGQQSRQHAKGQPRPKK